ncbi:hypothetical protein LSAT2_030027 [Lamellibrachia satsuma]|nr:hypothetical protein LSAT2_030027 [Lamellibrachia satsuma]
MNWTPRKTALFRKSFHEWLSLPSQCKRLSGKQVLLKFMKEKEIHCSLYAKVRTKIMNEQRKIQMKARKMLYDK